MPTPNPTPVLRLLHIDNLAVVLRRACLHAPKYVPDDGQVYATIHDVAVQQARHQTAISCGPAGVLHDYVPFYFGYLSPMLLRLNTGRVAGYIGDQTSLIYVVTTAQAVEAAGLGFVFSDGHGLARMTEWFDDLTKLDRVDWNMVFQRYWADTWDDPDRQRRKQAEFLIHAFCPWTVIERIVVISPTMRQRVETVLAGFPAALHRPVEIRGQWYY